MPLRGLPVTAHSQDPAERWVATRICCILRAVCPHGPFWFSRKIHSELTSLRVRRWSEGPGRETSLPHGWRYIPQWNPYLDPEATCYEGGRRTPSGVAKGEGGSPPIDNLRRNKIVSLQCVVASYFRRNWRQRRDKELTTTRETRRSAWRRDQRRNHTHTSLHTQPTNQEGRKYPNRWWPDRGQAVSHDRSQRGICSCCQTWQSAGLLDKKPSQPYILQTSSRKHIPVLQATLMELTPGLNAVQSWMFIA
jgi:hypothetical protein